MPEFQSNLFISTKLNLYRFWKYFFTNAMYSFYLCCTFSFCLIVCFLFRFYSFYWRACFMSYFYFNVLAFCICIRQVFPLYTFLIKSFLFWMFSLIPDVFVYPQVFCAISWHYLLSLFHEVKNFISHTLLLIFFFFNFLCSGCFIFCN